MHSVVVEVGQAGSKHRDLRLMSGARSRPLGHMGGLEGGTGRAARSRSNVARKRIQRPTDLFLGGCVAPALLKGLLSLDPMAL
jgi:hypothetical protein